MTSVSSPLDVVQTLYAAFARRDIAAMLSLLSPEVEWSEPENPYNPAGGVRKGHAGFLEWAEIGRTTEDVEVLDIERFLADAETVVAIGHIRCRAKTTGRRYESDFVHVIRVRAGLVTRFQEFFDTYAAGEAFRDDAGPGPPP
ncbi:MAG: nuclear transport factor 2 family protein [Gemmatimonadota bacterium]